MTKFELAVLILLMTTFGTGCRTPKSLAAQVQDTLLQEISKPQASLKDFIALVDRLPERANDRPAVWSGIASNSQCQGFQRRRAVMELLRRHLSPGCTVGELRTLFGAGNWLREANIFTTSGSIMPMSRNEDGDRFGMLVLASTNNPSRTSLYLVVGVKGKYTLDEFKDAIAFGKGACARAKILHLDAILPQFSDDGGSELVDRASIFRMHLEGLE